MSFANYKRYNEYKGFEEKLRKLYVCKNGDSMTGDLNMKCNDLINVKNINLCDGAKINGEVEFTENVTINGDVDISGNMNFKGNFFLDVGENHIELSGNDIIIDNPVNGPHLKITINGVDYKIKLEPTSAI